MIRNHALMACAFICLTSSTAFAHGSCSAFGAGSGAGPINTITAATMPQGKLAIGITTDYIQSDRFSDSALEDFAANHVHAHATDWTLATTYGLSFGLRDNLSLSVSMPYIHRENIRAGHHMHVGGMAMNHVEDHGDNGGTGDITALAKYRFWNQENSQAALLLGLKAPTGDTNARHDGETLDIMHQAGSGSWDALGGFSVGQKIDKISLDASALYTLTTEGSQSTDLGDRLHYNAAISYRIGGERHGHGDSVHQEPAWDLVLEMNGLWHGEKEANGALEEDSDSNIVYLAPGLRYSPDQKWAAHMAVGVPVIDNPGKGHTETDYKVTLGISRAF